MKISHKNKHFFGHINDFKASRGYFLGQFMGQYNHPILETDEVEIAWKKIPAHTKHDPHFHKKGVEITICVKGKAVCKVNNNSFVVKKGDFYIIYPRAILSEFTTLTDCEFVVVKAPSVPNDKFI